MYVSRRSKGNVFTNKDNSRESITDCRTYSKTTFSNLLTFFKIIFKQSNLPAYIIHLAQAKECNMQKKNQQNIILDRQQLVTAAILPVGENRKALWLPTSAQLGATNKQFDD